MGGKVKALEKIAVPIGKTLQKAPDLNLGTKGKKTFKATDTETKIVNFISNFPSMVARSYGDDIELIFTPKGREILKELTLLWHHFY